MKRRDFLIMGGGAAAIAGGVAFNAFSANRNAVSTENGKRDNAELAELMDDLKLTPPKGPIPVAVLISDGATVIDFAGPWEVFQDVSTPDSYAAFSLYTVAESLEPITASAGMRIVPNYTFATAPQPKVVMMGAQRGRSAATFEWLKKADQTADVVMSVCTGAFLLAQSGLIDGKTATTHHNFYDDFAKKYPNIELKRGVRFVEEKKYSSAGGLTSGIDLALRVVERYFGRETAGKTAEYMEYQSKGWVI